VTLADDLAHVLTVEPFGLSCRTLARRVHRRDVVVREALRDDARFERSGRNRGSRWRLASSIPPGRLRTGSGRILSSSPSLDASGVPLVGRKALSAS
jgi:hypothetical protein